MQRLKIKLFHDHFPQSIPSRLNSLILGSFSSISSMFRLISLHQRRRARSHQWWRTSVLLTSLPDDHWQYCGWNIAINTVELIRGGSISVSEQLPTYPFPESNINPNLLSIDCCWVRGGVGGQLPVNSLSLHRETNDKLFATTFSLTLNNWFICQRAFIEIWSTREVWRKRKMRKF